MLPAVLFFLAVSSVSGDRHCADPRTIGKTTLRGYTNRQAVAVGYGMRR